MSVRRLSWRPVSVVLAATGFAEPWPMVWKRCGGMFGKFFTRYFFTASARFSDSVLLAVGDARRVGVALDAQVGVAERRHRVAQRIEHEVGAGHDLVRAGREVDRDLLLTMARSFDVGALAANFGSSTFWPG